MLHGTAVDRAPFEARNITLRDTSSLDGIKGATTSAADTGNTTTFLALTSLGGFAI